jgi:hypothetical protein
MTRSTVLSAYNSCDAGTPMDFDGLVEPVLGFESITLTATASATATLSISTGATSTVSERISRTIMANQTATITLPVTAAFFQVSCKGLGDCGVQTLLHSGATNKMYSLASKTTGPQVVEDSTTLGLVVDFGGVVANNNLNVGVYSNSDDTTASAFAVQVSHDNVTFYDWSTFTTATPTTFQTFAVSGFRYFRVVYANSSMGPKNITLTMQWWV